ncbi:MAG: adenylate/guanylate cyclase domain-containing protein [Arenicellales bacterium]|nr:adenylate/guanylate cyclase domain-containing protein [Arenicellales bacterium]
MSYCTSRKLTVILHADVAGSTALVQKNEVVAHQRFRDTFQRLSEIIESYGGTATEVRGDALVAEFSRASDAVTAALAFQSAHEGYNDTLDDDIRPWIRIGISLGEVLIADGTVTGAGVVLAQRLEQLAEPGSVVVQGAVSETVPIRMPFEFESLGEQQLKGFDQPVRAFVVRISAGEGIPEPETHAEARSQQDTLSGDAESLPIELSNKPSVAVLPFTNMSGDPEQEYFSDGITEDIITALSHFRTFPVIARNSTFTYKGQAIRIQQVAAELGARYVLEGSIRKAGKRIRITAQLVDAETGHHVWADKFDSTLDDIFDVQDEISGKIVVTIQPELAQAELERATVKRPENLTAWDLTLRGMSFANRHTRDDHDSAREVFESAIELDPDYAGAWAGLAWSYLAKIALIGTDERQGLLEKGLQAALRAVELDDRSSFAHYVLGVAYAWGEQYTKSISEAEISVQLNPYHAQALMGLGNRLDLVGRTAEGISKMEQGLQLSPRDPFSPVIMAYLSRAHLSQEQPAKALEWIEKAVNLRPNNADLQYRLASCLAHLDRVDEAEKALNECERLDPGFLEKRKHWRPYSDNERNQRFFSGMLRHRLLSENHFNAVDRE